MGLIQVEKLKSDKHRRDVERFLSIEMYKVLECLLRNTLMKLGYVYQNENPLLSLTHELADEERLNLIEAHINNWELENKTEYGLQRVFINEFHEDIALLNTAYENLVDQFTALKEEVGRIHGKDKNVVQLKELLSNKIGKIERATAEPVKELDPSKLDYFTKYLGAARSIYYDLFEKMGKSQNPFNKFVSMKIIFEHTDEETKRISSYRGLPNVKNLFSPSKIKGRISGNLKSYDLNYGTIALDEGVLSSSFLQYLIDLDGEILKDTTPYLSSGSE